MHSSHSPELLSIHGPQIDLWRSNGLLLQLEVVSKFISQYTFSILTHDESVISVQQDIVIARAAINLLSWLYPYVWIGWARLEVQVVHA